MALIRQVTIEIGGQKIDQQYGMWLEIWDIDIVPKSIFLKENASIYDKAVFDAPHRCNAHLAQYVYAT